MPQYFLIIFALFYSISPIKAQYFYEKGVIVTTAGDTIKGFIRDEKSSKLHTEVFFRREESGLIERYTPNDLQAFILLPNQYYESHDVIIKNKSSESIHQRMFLYQIQEGYARVFKLIRNKSESYFVKKQGDTTVQSLYSVLFKVSQNGLDRTPIDTLTQFNINEFSPNTYLFQKNYLNTLTHLFSDWKEYKPTQYNLTLSDIKYQVRNYNKAVHADFITPKLSNEKYSKFVLTFSANALSPIWLKNKEPYFGSNIQSKKWNSSHPLGYELSIGILGKQEFKNIGLEIGYARTSELNFDYTYMVSGQSQINSGNIKGRYDYVFIKTTIPVAATRLSPYFGFEIISSKSGFLPNFTFLTGGQYLFSRQHALKLELDMIGITLDSPFLFMLKAGYQYRLRL